MSSMRSPHQAAGSREDRSGKVIAGATADTPEERPLSPPLSLSLSLSLSLFSLFLDAPGNYCREIDLIDTRRASNGTTAISWDRSCVPDTRNAVPDYRLPLPPPLSLSLSICLSRCPVRRARSLPAAPRAVSNENGSARTPAICAARKWDRII